MEMFSSSDPIFEFRGPFGVPVQIAPSIFMLVFIYVSFNGSPQSIFYDLVFLILLVGSIFLHEVGHAWGCIVQKIPVRRIMMHGGGGFCERARSASRYEDELIVAMGPIVNLFIWAIASLALPFVQNEILYWVIDVLAYINIFLALLNLMPVMPLDGGKLFHLLLMRFMHHGTATVISGTVGLIVAVLWIPMMLFSYVSFGLVLFFFPSIILHWQMLRRLA
ncbi:MAG: site-2 protease family protein [Paracoccaceae bacterium]